MSSGSFLKSISAKYNNEGIAGTWRAAIRRLASLGEAEKLSQSNGQAWNPYPNILDWLAGLDSFSIVQIGAFVGDSDNDPLCQFFRQELGPHHRSRRAASQVILVEPVKEYFDLLKTNYRDLHGVKFENVAIAESSGTRDFYRIAVRPEDHNMPDWLLQCGSLRADRMTALWSGREKTEIKDFYLANQVAEKITCITFDELVSRHNINKIDLLQIDAEGYDFEILRTIDFSKLTPRVINYEHDLLLDNKDRCRELLTGAGYVLFEYGNNDTLAIHIGH